MGNRSYLSENLDLADFRRCFTTAALQAGKAYANKGKVEKLTISDDSLRISAFVRGSAPSPYSLTISLKFTADVLEILDGHCSCPVRYNCKHVAAALFKAIDADTVQKEQAAQEPVHSGLFRQFRPAIPDESAKAVAAQLPQEIAEWLRKIERNSRMDNFPEKSQQRLVYIINAEPDRNNVPLLTVQILSTRILKSGDYSSSTSRPDWHNYVRKPPPQYITQTDMDILSELSVTGVTNYQNVTFFSTSALLEKMISTGRSHWAELSGPKLSWREEINGQSYLKWQMRDISGVRPWLEIPGLITMMAAPPVWVNAETGEAGTINLAMDPKLAFELLKAPGIPAGMVGAVSARLAQVLPPVDNMLPSEPEKAIKITADPKPLLHFHLEKQSDSYHYYYRRDRAPEPLGLVSVSFRYGPFVSEWYARDKERQLFSDGKLYTLKRKLNLEKDAISTLEAAGIVQVRTIGRHVDHRYGSDFTIREPANWLAFISKTLPALVEKGYEPSFAPDFPYQIVKPSSAFNAEISEGSGIDWLELDMGITVDGQQTDLGPLIATLISSPDFDPGKLQAEHKNGDELYLQMSDGRYLSMASETLLPIILSLHELLLGSTHIGKNGKILLSKADAALLAGFEHGENFIFKNMEQVRAVARTLNAQEKLAPVALPATFRAELRPYQQDGVAWLNLLREANLGGILADDMGLGKTVQVLALLSAERQAGRLTDPALIIAPTSLMTNWQNEISKFAPDLKSLVLQGSDRKQLFDRIPEQDIVLSTYPLIGRDHETLLKQVWHMCILDEAQTIKNPNASTTRLINGINARHRFCLTGTPMENHLGELWSLVNFVNPGFMGDRTSFTRNWRTPIEKHGNSERARLLSRRTKPFMLRRTKIDVAKDLPPKTEIIETVSFGDRQREVYDSIRISMHKKVRDAIAARGLGKSHIIILEALLKLRQACCDPRLLKLTGKTPPGSAKLERLLEMVGELHDENRKIIIFSQFTSMLALISDEMRDLKIPFSLLTGETRDRKSEINRFQSGEVSVFLISLKAGGVGLNLTAADTVILYDPWWNPAVEEQAIDRAYRIGQDKPVFVYRLVASQTIEQKMDELKARKRDLANNLFDPENSSISALSEEDLEDLFSM